MKSRVFEAQDALFALVEAGTYPGRVSVSLGAPPRLETDHVWIAGSVEDYPSEYRVSGLGQKDERFTLRACVWSKRFGRYTDARDRADELATVVEQIIINNHRLTNTVDLATLARVSVEDAIDEDGRAYVVLITLSVDCQAFVPNV